MLGSLRVSDTVIAEAMSPGHDDSAKGGPEA